MTDGEVDRGPGVSVYTPRVPRMWSALLACSLAAAALFAFAARAVEKDLRRPLSNHGSSYAGSRSCTPCHAGNYASWHRTFHRTMTQEASSDTVLGDFVHGSLRYMGVDALMRRDAQGRFMMEWSRAGGRERWSAVVERTVGSRRFQQYLARDADVYFRLPVAWNIEEQRFVHMNGAFLTPDPVLDTQHTSVGRDDYDRHVTRWNDNCVYCHNVAPRPGLDTATGRFDTHVAELGIACEACHGPAAEHVARNHNPLRRFALHVSGVADPSIASPARMSPERSAQVCGHCHGQRIAPNIERVHREGDRFVPGDNLLAYSRPLARDTLQNGQPGVFASRFWTDGTPRLTAYEYQGLLQSACAQRGELTCTTCHAMHDGDPRGQLRPERAGNALCTSCHKQFTSESATALHTHHRANGAGASCVGCHMPRIVYGIVGAHRSHRIDSPQFKVGDEPTHPDACTLCHVDKDRAWASNALGAWKNAPFAPIAQTRSEAARMLMDGDPIERALAADALGQTRETAPKASMAPRMSLLLDAMQNDDYPAVRAIAWRSLRSVLAAEHARARPEADAFTPTDTREQRLRDVKRILARLPSGLVVPSGPGAHARASAGNSVRIFIGE